MEKGFLDPDNNMNGVVSVDETNLEPLAKNIPSYQFSQKRVDADPIKASFFNYENTLLGVMRFE